MKDAVYPSRDIFQYEDFISSIEYFEENYVRDIDAKHYFGFPLEAVLNVENALLSGGGRTVAYFSMEFGLAPSIYNSFYLNRPMSRKNQFFTHEVFSNYWLCDYLFKVKIDKMLDIPIYGGGLGVLAGDTMKSAADEGFALVGIGILWNKGYFKQNFWYKHGQIPEELTWDPSTYPGLIPLKQIVTIQTKQGPLHLRLWKYYVYSHDRKNACPLILLDSNVEDNDPKFRRLTDQLYRSDDVWWKIFQRVILGIGGMKALESLHYRINAYHLNEGHAAFALVEKQAAALKSSPAPVSLASAGMDTDATEADFVYTCHTPVAAGHDRFAIDDVAGILPQEYVQAAQSFGRETPQSHQINLTFMCLNHCRRVNAVSQKHGEITRLQFPAFASKISAITNGVHAHTWVSESFAELFRRYEGVLGEWSKDLSCLSRVSALVRNETFRRDIFEAHQANKRHFTQLLKRWKLREDVLTIGWARRIAGYKRPALIFHDIEQILKLAHEVGPLQIILAGKAHPNDDIGSAHIDDILDHIDQLNPHKAVIKVLILENYDTYFAKLLTSSVDVWLNNPLPPFEASGTSGMKAILNGVLQLSTLDGWVVEAAADDIGWIFGYQHQGAEVGNERDLKLEEDAAALYKTLREVMVLYYRTYKKGDVDIQSPWIDKMINCVRKSAFFNTQRMVREYDEKMWSSVSLEPKGG